MDYIFIVLLMVILLYLFYLQNITDTKTDKFIQIQNVKHSPSYNAKIIKPIQVTSYHKPPQNSYQYQRDDWITNPEYSPNIVPKLINPNDNLPAPNMKNFENPKKIRQGAGHLIRPIELDASSSSNGLPEKPYLVKNTSKIESEYLDYGENITIKEQGKITSIPNTFNLINFL